MMPLGKKYTNKLRLFSGIWEYEWIIFFFGLLYNFLVIPSEYVIMIIIQYSISEILKRLKTKSSVWKPVWI